MESALFSFIQAYQSRNLRNTIEKKAIERPNIIECRSVLSRFRIPHKHCC